MTRMLHIVGSMSPSGIGNYIMNVYRNIDRNKVQFDFVENSIDVSESVIQMFSAFENCYTIFKNEYDLQGETEAERKILEYLKKYKLASSEGVNKLSNRMIRFEVLKKVLLQFDSIQAKDFELIRQRMEELTE